MRSDEKIWYRHVVSGELGYLVEREGVEMIRLNRPNEEIYRPLRTGEWTIDRDVRPLTKHQLVRIAWAADRELCRHLGLDDHGRTQWIDLPEEKRLAWAAGEGIKPPIRRKLRNAILRALKDLAA